jgi:DNA repair protein RecO (recombination protein O)
MALIESESLILKSYSLAEADKIVVFLTQEHGLIRGVAKGAKRLKSRFGGSLEPFSIVNLTFYQKEERELVSISNIELQKSYFLNAGKPEFLQKFAYLAELLMEFAPPNEPNERLYRMARVCLETGSNEPQNLESIALYFELWVLRLAGFLPNWQKCDVCQKDFGNTEVANLQINFHLLCPNCLKQKQKFPIKPLERQIYLFAQNLSPNKFIEFTLNKSEEVREISQILKRIISHILGKENVGERSLIAQNF